MYTHVLHIIWDLVNKDALQKNFFEEKPPQKKRGWMTYYPCCAISSVQPEDVLLFMQQLRWLAIETPGWKSSQLSTPQIRPASHSSFPLQSPSPRPHKPVEDAPQNFQGVGVGQHLKSVCSLVSDQHCLTAFSTRLSLLLTWGTMYEGRPQCFQIFCHPCLQLPRYVCRATLP